MPTFRSDTSASTTLTVNIYEVGRSGTQVTFRVNWSVTTGSGTSCGASTTRILRIFREPGHMIAAAYIKNGVAWGPSSTYSGSFDFAYDTGTYDAGTYSMWINTSYDGTQSCYWTDRAYCTNFDIGYSLFWTATSAPGNPRFSANPFEAAVTLMADAAAAGINNGISYYRYFGSINGGGEQHLGDAGTSLAIDTSGWARGTTLAFRVVSMTVRGDNPSSGWTGAAKKNRTPYQPTSPSVPKTSYIPGETIRVSYANTGDPDGNLAGFEAATDQDETIVGANASAAATYVDVDTTGWPQSIQRKFRVRGYDAFGVRGPWSLYTAVVTLNTAPLEPEISYPAAGSTVYSRRPRVLLRAAAVNDGPKHILCATAAGSETTTAAGTGFSCGVNDDLASGQQVVYQPQTDIPVGGTSISARMYDSFLYSPAVTRAFSAAVFAPTDPDLAVSGRLIRAAHITDLQTAVGNLRTAYGLAAVSWLPCVVGVTPISGAATLIEQLQSALQAVIDRINGWDAGNAAYDISVAWISPVAAGGGVDRVKLRQAIEQLRSTIILI